MYSFVEFESLKKWLVLALLTCRFLTFAYTTLTDGFTCSGTPQTAETSSIIPQIDEQQ